MIKAPLNLLSEKLNRLNLFISHDEAGFFGLFIALVVLSHLPGVCLEMWTCGGRQHPGTDPANTSLLCFYPFVFSYV